MEALQNINNYLIIHNGRIIEQKISEDIHVDGVSVTIHNATNLHILYSTDAKDNYTIDIDCRTSSLDLIEEYDFQAATTYHKVIHIRGYAHVRRYVNNATTKDSESTIEEKVNVASNASVTCAYVELSSSTIDAKYVYALQGEKASALLRLAALSKGNEKKQYLVSLEHNAPHTTGNMDNYGIAKDTSSLCMDGVCTIHKGNYQSSSFQVNKILVFDQRCKAKANPYLYIDEYDVKAGHGASVGKIDEDHLYYLQSRGLTKEMAMQLVTYGYFLPVLEFIKDEQLKEQFNIDLKAKVGI